ncbi:MAG: dipeptide ABC transporter ATP-binding protein [Anaerolineae bacterium]
MADPVLHIDDLTVAYRQGNRRLEAVRHVSLTLNAGQTCALVGESGSGKTTLAQRIMGYLPTDAQTVHGRILFQERDILPLRRRDMAQLWGVNLAMVPQDPSSALNPSMRVGAQVDELLVRAGILGRDAARARTLELLESVRLAEPAHIAQSYPHQVSGGMLQRVLIAMALGVEPDILVLDEPTTGLDVTTEAIVLDLIRTLARERRTAILYITHSLGVAAQISDRVVVLYTGEVLEEASTKQLYALSLHPYTQGLFDSLPRLGQNRSTVQLRPIQGFMPPLDHLPEGCVFRPRCPLAIDICLKHPPLYLSGPGHWSRCHRWDEISQGRVSAHQSPLAAPQRLAKAGEAEPAASDVLRLDEVSVVFPHRPSLGDALLGRRGRDAKVLRGVSLSVPKGVTVGLVGESGSGKTTLARAILGLTRRTGGEIMLREVPLPTDLGARGPDVVCCLQIVFQNPDEALNPYRTIGDTLRRPIMRFRKLSKRNAATEVGKLLESVQLPASYAERLPTQLSGGERQRVAIARAFAPNPAMVVADEPVSSLDVSVQAAVLSLLSALQVEHQTSLLFISHDLVVVGYLADVIAVIYAGALMEVGSVSAAFDPPYHPYSEALLSSVPLADPTARQEQIRLDGQVPSPVSVLTGCPFHTRCPRFLGAICVDVVPPWREDERTGKRIFCHIPIDELVAIQRRPFAFSSLGREEA